MKQMNLFSKIINKFKREQVDYPNDFAIIEFSKVASSNGIVDNQNKIIYRYSYDKHRNLNVKKYQYSKERVQSLKEVYNIPIFDKTNKEIRFPVFAKVLPGEIGFQSK